MEAHPGERTPRRRWQRTAPGPAGAPVGARRGEPGRGVGAGAALRLAGVGGNKSGGYPSEGFHDGCFLRPLQDDLLCNALSPGLLEFPPSVSPLSLPPRAAVLSRSR